jgi:hypothetical protein
MKRKGRKSASQTPSPKKDRIYGSKKNPPNSATSKKASSIKLSNKVVERLKNKLKEFKKKNPDSKNITLSDEKAVYRRGAGAYSKSHRPTISGGKPNTRNAWAMARVNKFLKKASGEKVKKAYVQDDDLMKYENGGEIDQNTKKIIDNFSSKMYLGNYLGIENPKYSVVDGTITIIRDEPFTIIEREKIKNFVENVRKKQPYSDLIKDLKIVENVIILGTESYESGGQLDSDHKETYEKWKKIVNMSKSELEAFYNSKEGKEAGLSPTEAQKQGIDSGRESARWIMRMKDTPVKDWTPNMWRWAKKQISFISRMSGNKGKLHDAKGRKTRKHTSLLIWGHNPQK